MHNESQSALLFDLDGTLAETNGDLHAAMNHVLGLHGLPPIASDSVRHMIGGGARMILGRGFAEHGITPNDATLDAATQTFVHWYEDNIDAQTYVFDHLMPLLNCARAAGIKMAVVTNKREGLAAKLLFRLGLNSFFDVLVGGDTLPERKPHKLPITHALQRLGVAPENAVMLGDSEADSESARAAGVACICVSFGYRRVSLEDLGADKIIDSFAELPAALAEIKPGRFTALENID